MTIYETVFDQVKPEASQSGMDYPEVLRETMRVGGLKQTELAKRLKVKQPTISRWLKGAKPKHQQHERIVALAESVGVVTSEAGDKFTTQAMDAGTPPPRVVRVVGYVGAGAVAHFYAVAQGDLDEIPAPAGSTDSTVAVEIRGDSLGTLFDRWLVFYDDVRRPVTADLAGKLCVVGLADERVLIKKIRPVAGGLFDLFSEREDPIRGVVIEWAARVKQMVPR